jgi:hypothetical protein
MYQIRSNYSTTEDAAILKAREPSIARLPIMLLAAAGGLVLHMAPCTGRAEVIMAFYWNPFLPVKCSGEIEKWPLKRLVLPIECHPNLTGFFSLNRLISSQWFIGAVFCSTWCDLSRFLSDNYA